MRIWRRAVDDGWDHKVELDSGLHHWSSGNDELLYRENLESLDQRGQEKAFTQGNVWCRKEGCMQVESLPCHWQQVREDGRVPGAPCWAGRSSWAGFVWQERRGSSCIVASTAGYDTVSMAPPERILLFSPGHWHSESTSVSSHETAGTFWWLLNLFCFHYLSKPGKFLNTTNVPQVSKVSWVSLCWVIAWVFVARGGSSMDTPGPGFLQPHTWTQAEAQTDWD